jgi:transcriptional regulator with XRE-family HTH domain
MLNSKDFDIFESSQRLRDLRTERKISFDTLAEAIGVSPQVLKNYELACRYRDCPPNLQPNKMEAIAGMSISTLYKIAQYFNVSTDYLLGFTKYPTPNATLRSICEYTGLSEKAVLRLHDKARQKGSSISAVIESQEFWDIIHVLNIAKSQPDLLIPNGKPIKLRISNKIKEKQLTEEERISERLAVAVAQRGLAPLYKQEISENITILFNSITQPDK